MKYLSILFFQIVWISMTFARQEGLYFPVNIQKGIDSCIVYQKNKKGKKRKQIHSKYFYNKQALMSKALTFNRLGHVSKLYAFQYDTARNVLEKLLHDLPYEKIKVDTSTQRGKKFVKERRWHNRKMLVKYEYNEHHSLTKERIYSASYDTDSLTEEDNTFIGYYSYNSQGCLIEEIIVYPRRKAQDKVYTDTIRYECDSQNNHTLEVKKLFGENQWVKRYTYNEKGKLVREDLNYQENKPNIYHLYEYDSLSNLIFIHKIDEEGNEFETHQMEFQDALISLNTSWQTDNGYLQEITYQYDLAGRVLSSYTKILRGSGYHIDPKIESGYGYKQQYDAQNRLVEQKMFWKSSKRYERKEVFFYDKKNRIIRDREYDSKNKLTQIHLYFYNDIDTLVEKMAFDADSAFVNTEKYFHDSLGVKITREISDADGFVTLYQTYKYDEKGKEIGGVFYHNGYLEELHQFQWNEDGTYRSREVTIKQGKKLINHYSLVYKYYKTP